jgi:hypothetical protein
MDYTAMLTPSLGAGGLLAVVIYMIFTGRLVPRSQVDDMRADKDRQIDLWKAAYDKAIEGQEVQRDHITALMEANRTTTRVIQALPVGAMNERGPHALAEAEEE